MRPIVPIVLLLAFTACRVAAPGEDAERDALAEEGAPYTRPFEERELPEVDAHSPYFRLLDRALKSDPELEAAYFDWAAAFARAIQAGSPADPTFGIGWMFPVDGVWNSLMLLAAVPLGSRSKLEGNAKVALEEARAAHARLESLRFLRKGRFRQSYAAFDYAAREQEITRRERELLSDLEGVTRGFLASGKGSASDLMRLRTEITANEDAVAAAAAELRTMAAHVNHFLSREALAPLDPPEPMEPLEFDATDEQLLALASQRNPAIVELRAMIEARKVGVERADVEGSWDPMASYEKQGVNQVMLSFTIPLNRARVRAVLDEAEARLKKAQAELRAKRNDVAAETAAAIAMFREASRRHALLDTRWLPQAREAYDVLLAKFGAGSATYTDVIDAKRALLELERAREKARTDREAAVGDLLACCGADVSDSASQRMARR
jgi:outer membrane protein TolC